MATGRAHLRHWDRLLALVATAVLVTAAGVAGAGSASAAGATGATTPGTQTTLGFTGLNDPGGVAVDGAGDVFLADTGNNRVVELPKGGSQATVGIADLNFPLGVAVDGAGDVFATDNQHNRVVELPKGGSQATLAFTGLNFPSGVAVDSAGDVFVADTNNSRVLELPKGGSQATLAFTGLSSPGGLAVDGAGDVFVADTQNSRVVELPKGGSQVTVGTTGLFHPDGVAVDGAGNVFVADTLNNRVVELPKSGSQAILSFTGLASPGGVAVDGQGNVFVSDTNNTRVVELVNAAPAITSAAGTAFVVSLAGSFTVTASGFPAPAVTETGALPSGVTYNGTTKTLSGTPAQGTAGTYAITLSASNGVGSAVTQAFTLTVSQAMMTYPTNGQANVDTTKAFTWSTIPQAQAYDLIIGSQLYKADLVSSGVLPPTQSSLGVPALPVGPMLHATLFAEVNGAWSYQETNFTAAPGEATFTFPLNGQIGIDPTRAFTWSTIPQAQAYFLGVGTSQYGTDLVSSGVLPPTQSSYATPILPSDETLYASLFTEVNGAFSRVQSVAFVAGPDMGILTHPVDGQANVATPGQFTWSTIAAAQHYYLVIGTTHFGTDLVNSGLLPPTQSAFNVGSLPAGKTLYATLLTEINGTWVFQAITFTAR